MDDCARLVLKKIGSGDKKFGDAKGVSYDSASKDCYATGGEIVNIPGYQPNKPNCMLGGPGMLTKRHCLHNFVRIESI